MTRGTLQPGTVIAREFIVEELLLDQLPQHAKLESSTFASDTFNQCVVGTLVGQTINAAGPDGKGGATHAFKFLPMQ